MVHRSLLVPQISPPSISHNPLSWNLPPIKQRKIFKYFHMYISPYLQQDRMDMPQVPIVLVCLMMALTIIHAQNTPKDFVDAHNAARAEVGAPPLVWDNKVAAYARGYAHQRSKDCAMEHSTGPYGENLAEGSWDMSAKEAVGMWVDEKKLYDVVSNSCVGGDSECLHYTQVVWKKSARVGCARARCPDGGTFVTCNYDPPGNFIGERPF